MLLSIFRIMSREYWIFFHSGVVALLLVMVHYSNSEIFLVSAIIGVSLWGILAIVGSYKESKIVTKALVNFDAGVIVKRPIPNGRGDSQAMVAALTERTNRLYDLSVILHDCVDSLSVSHASVSGGYAKVMRASVEQGDLFDMMSSMFRQTTHAIDPIQSSISSMHYDASSYHEKTSEVRSLLNQSSEIFSGITNSIVQINQRVESLEGRVEEIISIMNMLSDISDQTNLLALNASIEAEVAGEFGKGFAVVANEVRRLASRSFKPMEQISSIANEVSSSVDSISRSVQSMEELMNDGKSVLSSLMFSTEGIVSSYDDISERIGTIESSVVALGSLSAPMSKNISAYNKSHAKVYQVMESIDEALKASHKHIDAMEHSLAQFKI